MNKRNPFFTPWLRSWKKWAQIKKTDIPNGNKGLA